MRLHVISLPHTEVHKDYGTCAYTQKVRKFCDMMGEDHEIFLYSSGRNEALCTEHIQILTEAEYQEEFKEEEWHQQKYWAAVDWNADLPYWKNFNQKVINGLQIRLQPHDLILFITGYSQRLIMDAFPNHLKVEFGIGYQGTYPTNHHVFESYTWMHCLYGHTGPTQADGKFYDTVIPNYFDINEFPSRKEAENKDYYLFMSRMIPRKGYQIAIEATQRIGQKLIIAGTGGDRPEYDHVEYVGYADSKTRGELMRNAIGLFCPTLYLEPFGGITIEANLCGCPVITTDFGVFPETIQNDFNGWRCHTMAEFEQAALNCQYLTDANCRKIRRNAQQLYGYKTIRNKYNEYFDRLNTLWADGFYTHLNLS